MRLKREKENQLAQEQLWKRLQDFEEQRIAAELAKNKAEEETRIAKEKHVTEAKELEEARKALDARIQEEQEMRHRDPILSLLIQ